MSQPNQITLSTGDTFAFRHLTPSERNRFVKLLKRRGFHCMGFLVGCMLLEDDGTEAFTQMKRESDVRFAERVGEFCTWPILYELWDRFSDEAVLHEKQRQRPVKKTDDRLQDIFRQ